MGKATSRNYRFTVPTQGNGIYVKLRLNAVWRHSPRVNGRLVLRNNLHTRELAYCHHWQGKDRASEGFLDRDCPNPALVTDMIKTMERLEAESYGRFRGKLYKGNASLGVTFASWKQSADMIRQRYSQLADLADKRFAWIKLKHRLKQRITAKEVASFHLEVIFGWMPLLQDVHAAATTIIDTRPKVTWVRSKASTIVEGFNVQNLGGLNRSYRNWRVEVRNTRAVQVEVDNPNLWLRERAGLNNPSAVAWDLVPWSFVVNMFVNTGQLVNSLTDFAGLTFRNTMMVKAYKGSHWQYLTGHVSGSTSYSSDYKYQVLNGVTPPPLVLKVPGMNVETLAMAASLFTQKFSRVLRFLK